jgi:hypothetical protein
MGNQHGNFLLYGYGALRRRLAPLKLTLGMERSNGVPPPRPPYVIVEIAELAVRFRETRQAMQDALGLPAEDGPSGVFLSAWVLEVETRRQASRRERECGSRLASP